ncbi:MAG: hypothetical protein RIM23_21375 [Coleofasciculus sp. G3-WIS-01]|uniref:hypothetical protein n=1 Tax=Coleofasciculus sp. G3-WIS-01 TaxID=3069528 RepID=UPI0032F0A9FC
MATATWTRRHVLSLEDFTSAEYDTLLQTAASCREILSRRTKKVPALQGQVVANMFFEPSTRTRSSFELAAKRLSADTLNFAPGTSSLTKGETILDTAKTYLAMGADMMVIRHREAGVPHAIATEMDRLDTNVGILNAGDGQHEHPSQALLDLFTITSLLDFEYPRLKLLADKKIAIVGDIIHSRVARSNIWSLTASGAEVHLAGPPTLVPQEFTEYIHKNVGAKHSRPDLSGFYSNPNANASPNPQPPIPNPQPPIPNPQPPIPNPQPPIANPQSPIPNPQSPTPNPQSPIPNRQSPIPNPQSPIANRQSPIANPQSPIPNRQSPTANRQSPTPNRQSPVTSHQLTNDK